MPWWSDNNFRMIQNNTRDIDAAMDVDAWIAQLKEFACNVAMVGVGGITSFYPTELEFQIPSPYLRPGEDKVREIVDKCHAAGIRVIGRFDFNRLQERFYEAHKDWFFRAADGRLLRCNDTVTTCINGWYQSEYSLVIIKEALDRYPLDGIFFNAFGFSNWDFYGNHYGVCHCDNCKDAFRAYSGGQELPMTEGEDEPAHAVYEAFKRDAVQGVLAKIERLARSYGPELCVCTYNTEHLDIVRNESNSGIGRPYPFPLMQSSMNVARARHAWPHLVLGNCVINATDLRWRYSGVAHGLTEIRLYENIAQGSVLDFCINGVFEDYPDRGSVEAAKAVFRYHQRNESYYGKLVSKARVAVARPEASVLIHDKSPDAMGVFKALKEEHIPFDMLTDSQLLKDRALRERYSLVIVPDAAYVDQRLLSLYRGEGRKLIALGAVRPLKADVAAALGAQVADATQDNAGAYMVAAEKDVWTRFLNKDWIACVGRLGLVEAKDWRPLLKYRSPASFGPAERAYGGAQTEYGCAVLSPDGKQALVPWELGAWYWQHGYQDHRYVLADLIDHMAPEARVIKTDAHPCVELFWDQSGDCMLLQMLNLSGFNGTTVEAALPICDVRVELPLPAASAKTLNGGEVALERTDGGCAVTLARLERFEAIALR